MSKDRPKDFIETVEAILQILDEVESGRSKGSRGSYAADGVPTLCDVTIPVDLLRSLKGQWAWLIETAGQNAAVHKAIAAKGTPFDVSAFVENWLDLQKRKGQGNARNN